MDPALVLKTSAALLGLAAAVGMTMAGLRFAGVPHPPAALAMVHGLLAGAALTLLIYAACTVGIPTIAKVATAVLVVAAAIGSWLNLGYHQKGRALPMPAMAWHILIALAGFSALLAALVTQS